MMRVGLWTGPRITTQCGRLPKRLTRATASHQYAAKRLSIPQQVGWPAETRSKSRKAYEYSSPEATFARHILRTLLRECTYLPDSVAAEYIKQHTRSRFRVNGYKAWKNRELFEAQDKTRRQEARQAISTLQRANEGERKCLLKTLHTTYGRIGKRRHELLRPLLSVKGQQEALNAASDPDSIALEDDSASIDGNHETNTKQPTAEFSKLTPKTPLDITPQLRAVLNSQIRVKPPLTNRQGNPRRIEPIIPELNSWLRPTPQKVIKNKLKRHYAHLLDHVQPPLPAQEWERLRDLASGKLSPEIPPPRRKRAVDFSVEDRTVEETEGSALELVARYGRLPPKAFGNRAAQRISPRFMQRLYAEVFSQCPVMEWDNAREEWKVIWGFEALLLQVNEKPGSNVDRSTAHSTQTSDTTVEEVNA